MAFTRGGARPGAGRPRKIVKFAGPIADAENRIADRLPKLIKNLEFLADGGYYEVTETWELAALVMKNEYKEVEGPRGAKKVVNQPVQLFPDAEPDKLVCVKRTRRKIAPDRGANEYLVDRIFGRVAVLDDPEPEDTGKVEVTDTARTAALEKAQRWRQQNAEQLRKIRNPLEAESPSMNPESSTMDES